MMTSSDVMARASQELGFTNEILSVRWSYLIEQKGPAQANLIRCVLAAYQMTHSWQLLSSAAETAHQHGSSILAGYLREHADEESLHFTWALDDYAQTVQFLGENRTIICAPAPCIVRMIDRQYGFVRKAARLSSFMGYVLALEGFPARPGTWEAWCEKNGLALSLVQSPIRHSVADQDHRIELFEHISEKVGIDEAATFLEARACLTDIARALDPAAY